jgi:hypothetical protein
MIQAALFLPAESIAMVVAKHHAMMLSFLLPNALNR